METKHTPRDYEAADTERDRLREVNAELLAACLKAKERWDFIIENFPNRSWKNGDQAAYDAVNAAIAKATS